MFRLLIILSFAIPFCAHAQDQQQRQQRDTATYRLPQEVVVTASRLLLPLSEIPFGTTIVDRKSLEAMPRAVAADEPLRLTPGVKVDNQANGSRVHLSIRGQGILTERGIRGIKVLYDECPLNDPSGFAPDFFDIDMSSVGRVDVLRGPAASLYGASASGGVLAFTSRPIAGSPLGGAVDQTVGSNGFSKTYGELGGTSGTMSYRVGGSRALGEGYRVHTHFSEDITSAKLVWAPSPAFTLTPVFSWNDTYHENPEGINLAQFLVDPTAANPDAVPYNEYLETKRVRGGASGTWLAGPAEVRFTGYAARTVFTEANNHTFNHRTLVTPGLSTQVSYASDIGNVRNTVAIGVDLGWQSIDEHRVDNLHAIEGDTIRSKEEITQRGAGIFLLDNIAIEKRWTVLLSLRYDDIRNELNDLMRSPVDLSGTASFAKTTGRIGLTYAATEQISFYGNWGMGFLPPATEELAQNPDHFGGFNMHLVPATSNGFEAGVRGTPYKNLDGEVAFFTLTTENDFDRYRITDPLRTQETFYRNAGSSKRFGLETEIDYSPIENIVVKGAYTWSHFTYTNGSPTRIVMDDPTVIKYAVSGNFLPNSPEHQLALDVKWSPIQDLSAGVTLQTLSKTYIDGANMESEAAAGYTLIDGRLSYLVHLTGFQAEATFAVRNIGNKMYAAFTEPDPGGNAYQPGAGREFFGGLSVRF